jgi:tRNA pseudouridine38-40 synthase
MPRYKLTIEYDGAPYIGWQKQIDAPSVQQNLADAVFKFCGEAIDVIGAGRTDAGVHATAQVAHIELSAAHDPFRIMQAINFHLFNTENNRISVIKAEAAADDFHARFSATRRHYLYRIVNRRARLALDAGRAWHVIEPLDVQAMQAAAALLAGTHDFSSFRDTQCQAKSPVKTLEKLQVERRGGEIWITASARSFLHHQMRIMTGSLALVGKGKWTLKDMQTALDARDRKKGGPTAPPDGLYLTGVEY